MSALATTTKARHPELERLICMALSNEVLAHTLVCNPSAVLASLGNECVLKEDERAKLCAITSAADIHDFAAQLHALLHSQ